MRSKLDATEQFFRNNPWIWIDGRRLEKVGGVYAWRSRVSDCRTKRGLHIVNRQRPEVGANGETYTVSEYQFNP